MAEYGFALIARGPREGLHSDVMEAVKRQLRRNHEVMCERNPKVPELGEDWLRVGPVLQSIAHDLCPANGDPVTTSHQGCETCGGSGLINPRVLDGVFDHHFAWYVNDGGSLPALQSYADINSS